MNTFETVAKILAEYKDVDVTTITEQATLPTWAWTRWTLWKL
jgi:hypothetical protein